MADEYTPEQIQQLIADKQKSDAEAIRLKGVLATRDEDIKTRDKKLKELETSNMTAEEKLRAEYEEKIKAAEEKSAQLDRERSKLNIKSGLAQTGLQIDNYAETIELLGMSDPDTSTKITTGLQKIISDAIAAGELKANQTHLKNNSAPGGNGGGNSVTREQFDKMNYSEMVEFSQNQPELYKQYTGG